MSYKERRAAYLAQGRCPLCGGQEPVIPGLRYGARCREAQRKRHVPKANLWPPTPVRIPSRSVWEPAPDGLGDALFCADAVLRMQP